MSAPASLMRSPWLRKRVRDLWAFWYLTTHGREFVGTRMGYRLLFDLDNTLDKYLLAFGAYEDAQRRTLFAAAQEATKCGGRRVFLDVGAHWGIYSLWAWSARLFDRVVAVEADPRNLAQLHANLFLNGLTADIDVIGAAAASAAGELAFSLAGRRSRDVSKVATLDGGGGASEKTVRAVRLDDIETMRGGALVAKIDVEGYEREVIQGMRGLLTGNRGLLQVEVFADSANEFNQVMDRLGYRKFTEIDNDRYYRNY